MTCGYENLTFQVMNTKKASPDGYADRRFKIVE
jgi:hypothetical protein